MSLINSKVELPLTRIENCVPAADDNSYKATFKITDVKLYVPIVTLSTEDSVKLSKPLSEEFKIPVYWNKYKVIPDKTYA